MWPGELGRFRATEVGGQASVVRGDGWLEGGSMSGVSVEATRSGDFVP